MSIFSKQKYKPGQFDVTKCKRQHQTFKDLDFDIFETFLRFLISVVGLKLALFEINAMVKM